jgi:hydrocephalus-inducing protein
VVPIEVKNGPRYNLELKANITIPEITIENLQSDTIDFNSVIIGQRKTIFIRFVNNKEITCEWSLNTRIELVGVDKGAETRYSIYPSSGII